MPSTTKVEVKCEKCKRPFEADVIDHIDLHEDPELIRPLRNGKANRVQCPKCRKVMYLDRSIVVNFEPMNLVVVYDPNAKSKEAREALQKHYENITRFNETLLETGRDMEFRVITDLKELRKLLDQYVRQYGL